MDVDSIRYGVYPQNADLKGLPIEYKQKVFTEQPIDRLTNNKV